MQLSGREQKENPLRTGKPEWETGVKPENPKMKSAKAGDLCFCLSCALKSSSCSLSPPFPTQCFFMLCGQTGRHRGASWIWAGLGCLVS